MRACLFRFSSHRPFILSSRHCSVTMSPDDIWKDADLIEIKDALIGKGNDLNGYQKMVTESILNPQHNKPHHLIIQPTGSGKSLCFQLPILYRALRSVLYTPKHPSMGIVVTPTISLMEDQVQQLQHKMDTHELPLKVSCYHHCLLEAEKERVIDELQSRYINLLYATPESLLQLTDRLYDDPLILDNRDIDIIDEDTADDQDNIIDDEDIQYSSALRRFREMQHQLDFYQEQSNRLNPSFSNSPSRSIETKHDENCNDTDSPNLKKLNITHVAFDECHLITESSILYRHEYCYELQYLLSELRHLSALSKPQIIALTASLTQSDQSVLLQKLGIDDHNVHRFVSTNWERPNLSLNIEQIQSKKSNAVIEDFKFDDDKYRTPSIVYCSTRRGVDRVTTILKANQILNSRINEENEECTDSESGIKLIEGYHAGCNRRERRELQDRFTRNVSNVLIATNAFGLGVNKNDVSSIIHLGVPLNVEKYYQETGRAGRDRQSQEIHNCVCYFNASSLRTNQFLQIRPLFHHEVYDNNDPVLHGMIKENILKFYQMMQFMVRFQSDLYRNGVLTEDEVSDFLCTHFEFIFGFNKANYWRNELRSPSGGLLDDKGVLVDVRYYIGVLRQLEYIENSQQEYFDLFIPRDLVEIIGEIEVEGMYWILNYLLNEARFVMDQWNTILVMDIQKEWDLFVRSGESRGMALNEKKEIENTNMNLKRIEGILELIRLKYSKWKREKMEGMDEKEKCVLFDFEKDIVEVGFILTAVGNKYLDINDEEIERMMEWDEDIRRQRQKSELFVEWLEQEAKRGDGKIDNKTINRMFQNYFKND